ncbi:MULTISPECIES: hypothetical protein [unclassified Haladaptatus]|uniref:hypothetical protein n=1 Tax=unclassified Haladaptatus TaxID=2622732 RepID=UPI0023E8CFE0|nr:MULTISPECIES: hypothetical protein [unclassified Haladaptatus]
MVLTDSFGVFAGAIALGAFHGIEPGHGWPVAASYALGTANKWAYGLAASVILGVGHLVSSIAMVGAFFYAKAYFDLTEVNQPITIFGDVQIGGPVSLAAGFLLIGLGLREYVSGHSHGHGGHDHDHPHSHEAGHSHDHSHDHSHSNDHARDSHTDRGLLGIAWFAFLLGFAHEEEFEIIALCAGSDYCLELMGAYALTVIAGIVGLTLLLIAGYQEFEEQVERYTPYLPVFSAAVLVVMGVGFISGLL